MAHLCINCNSPKVTRTEDEFTCAQCGYTWTVTHEQANAVYLAAQGRAPAASVDEPSEIDDLAAALGLDQPPAKATGAPLYDIVERAENGAIQPSNAALWPVMEPPSVGDSSTPVAEIDGPTADTILREPHPLTAEEADRVEQVLSSKTVAELEDIAAEAGIDLDEARLKADKVQALIESGCIFLADDGDTVIVVNDEPVESDE